MPNTYRPSYSDAFIRERQAQEAAAEAESEARLEAELDEYTADSVKQHSPCSSWPGLHGCVRRLMSTVSVHEVE